MKQQITTIWNTTACAIILCLGVVTSVAAKGAGPHQNDPFSALQTIEAKDLNVQRGGVNTIEAEDVVTSVDAVADTVDVTANSHNTDTTVISSADVGQTANGSTVNVGRDITNGVVNISGMDQASGIFTTSVGQGVNLNTSAVTTLNVTLTP